MNMNIVDKFIKSTVFISDDSAELLEKIALESESTPRLVVERLIQKEDERRHVSWSRSERKIIRRRCNLKNCFETFVQNPNDGE
jgi:hypothetical protein